MLSFQLGKSSLAFEPVDIQHDPVRTGSDADVSERPALPPGANAVGVGAGLLLPSPQVRVFAAVLTNASGLSAGACAIGIKVVQRQDGQAQAGIGEGRLDQGLGSRWLKGKVMLLPGIVRGSNSVHVVLSGRNEQTPGRVNHRPYPAPVVAREMQSAGVVRKAGAARYNRTRQ